MQLMVGGKLLFEKHAESQELQSDSCAVRVLDTALSDDRRLLAAVQGFASGLPKRAAAAAPAAPAKPNAVEEVSKLVELVSRPVDAHPSTEQRLRNLDAMLAKLRERPANLKPPGAKPAVKPKLG